MPDLFIECFRSLISCIWLAIEPGLIVGVPIGAWVGILLGPARVSGVDFRQWFWDPTQPSEVSDDSWIGLVRTGAHILAGAAALSLLIGSAWQWLLVEPICRFDNFTGVLSVVADCLGFWVRWKNLLGIAVGVAAVQFIAEMVWSAGLRWLPALPQRARALVQREHVNIAPRRPSPPRSRRIVVCCDGTWNWPQPERETNVVRLLRAIRPTAQIIDGEQQAPRSVEQISYYHLGVGTGNIVDRAVGGGTGVGLSNSVKTCYGFLVDNYSDDDEILLFGFSRGAYVVRSLAGMIGIVGLLQKAEMVNFYEMWDWYTQRDRRNPDILEGLAPNRRRPGDVTMQCIGVWDTVGALGVPGTRFCAKEYTFHQTELGEGVCHAFQALAIDERRGNFQAAPWVPPPDPDALVFEQVWFPGVHSNIGGGYDEHGLSDTTLLWMVSQILQYRLLDLDVDYITRSLDQSVPYPTGKLINSRTWAWRLLGSAVPRPVGTTSTAEKIHESAFDYAKGIYAGARRQEWLAHTDVATFARTDFERNHAVTQIGARNRRPIVQSGRLSWCDWLMQQVSGSA